MENHYLSYYKSQAGGGLPSFEGVRFQRGRGWFSRLGSSLLPVLRYLGAKAAPMFGNIISDLNSGTDLKSSLKKRGLHTLGETVEDGGRKVKSLVGGGVNTRKRRKSQGKFRSNKRPKKALFATKVLGLKPKRQTRKKRKGKSKTSK